MKRFAGFSLIEVLVTIVLLAFGLLGVAGMISKTGKMEVESYQRSQALSLVNDMVSRLQSATPANVASYVTTASSPAYLGTGDNLGSCSALTDPVAIDQCEWSNALKGAAESVGGANVGAMVGARGCITQIRAPVTTAGSCASGLYLVTVVWQGMFATAAPSTNNTCGQGLYGSETLRRSISVPIGVGTVGCS